MRMTHSRWTIAALTGLLALAAGPVAAAPKKTAHGPAHAPARKTAQKAPHKTARKATAKKTAARPTALDASFAAQNTLRLRRAPGDSWPMFRGNSKHTAFTPITVSLPLSPAWTWHGADAVDSSPAIVNGTVYFGTRDDKGGMKGSLVAVDLSSGAQKWRYSVSDKARTILTHGAKVQATPPGANLEAIGWVESSPVVYGPMVYVMSRDGALHALTTDGTLKWRLRTGGLDLSSPNVVGGTVYFGSGYPNKDFWAVDAASGIVKWRTNSGIANDKTHTGQYIYSSQAVDNGVVYASANDGGFYALDAATGKVKWRYETNGGVYLHSPTVAGSLLVGAPGDFDTNVYAFDLATGQLAWKYASGLAQSYVSSPAYDGSTIYIGIGTPDQRLVALDGASGEEKWHIVTGYSTEQSFTSSPAVTNNVIFVGTAQAHKSDPSSGRLIALDKATGSVLWETSLPAPVVSSPAVAGNTVVVGCMNGSVYAFKWSGASS